MPIGAVPQRFQTICWEDYSCSSRSIVSNFNVIMKGLSCLAWKCCPNSLNSCSCPCFFAWLLSYNVGFFGNLQSICTILSKFIQGTPCQDEHMHIQNWVKCTVGTWTCSAVSNRSINLETGHLAPRTCEPVHPRSSPVLHGLHGTVRPRFATVNPDLLQLPRFCFF